MMKNFIATSLTVSTPPKNFPSHSLNSPLYPRLPWQVPEGLSKVSEPFVL
jgi:hypothetical protein